MKHRGAKILLGILILVVLSTAVYFTFFFSYKCDTLDCYLSKQEVCSKTTHISDSNGIVWEYNILGKEKKKCIIDVKVLRVKQGSLDRGKIEETSMICELALGSRNFPEAEISLCHGLLKEGLQDLIIKKLHEHILQNLGEIGAELSNV